jgi:hypothetical protein
MHVYQELHNMKEWLSTGNWPRTESLEVVTAACNEIWNLMNQLENNVNTLLAKSSILPLIDQVLQEIELYRKKTYLPHPFTQDSISEIADKLIQVIDILLATEKSKAKLPL